MIAALKVVLAILITLTATGLTYAVLRVGRRRQPRSADPQSFPYGDMPGFTREQLELIARRPVPFHNDLNACGCGCSPQGSERRRGVLSADAAARTSPVPRRRRRAF